LCVDERASSARAQLLVELDLRSVKGCFLDAIGAVPHAQFVQKGLRIVYESRLLRTRARPMRYSFGETSCRTTLQLSWNYNYGQAGEFFATDFGWNKSQLLSNPAEASSSPAKMWKTSMFFWMAWKSQDKNYLLLGLHCRFLREGFGATIRAINGALECPSSAAAQARRQSYQSYCSTLGVGGCDQKLDCPAL
jgi:hypothetical protein